MKAREYLKEIHGIKKSCAETVRQIELLTETRTKLSNETAISCVDDAIDELEQIADSLGTQCNVMTAMFTELEDPMECMVLMYRYQHGYCWEDIAYKLKTDARNVKRIHALAIRSLDELWSEYEDAEEE